MVTYQQHALFDQAMRPSSGLTFRELPATEHPAERLARHGSPALSDAEILALILDEPSFDLAHRLLQELGAWTHLDRASPAALLRVAGMTPSHVARLKAALEISRRRLLHQPEERRQIQAPADAAPLFMAQIGHLDHEEVWTLSLDTKNRILDFSCVSVGCVNAASIRTGEVFKRSLELNATSIIIGHGHPSGDITPSHDDLLVTRQLVQAGQLLDCELLDHFVVSGSRYCSMRERRLGW